MTSMQRCTKTNDLAMDTVVDYYAPVSQISARDAAPSPADHGRSVGQSRLSRTAKTALVRLGIVAMARKLPTAQDSATILRYHSVSASGDYRSPTIAVSPELFERQMNFLARHYNVFSLGELLTLFSRRELPRNSVAITFDDGYLDNATEALPILARYGLPATFFVTSDSVLGKGAFWVGWLYRAVATAPEAILSNAFMTMTGTARSGAPRNHCFAALATLVDNAECNLRKLYLSELERLFPTMPPLAEPSDFMMTIRELRELHNAGMTIGAHTATHRVLAGIDREVAYEEIARSKADLESALDTVVEHLAYPNGHVLSNVDAAAVSLARQAGFQSAGTSRRGILTRESSFLDLPRQGVNEALGFEGFVFKLEETRFSRLLRA